jgi:hypothetical protein
MFAVIIQTLSSKSRKKVLNKFRTVPAGVKEKKPFISLA